MNSWGLALGAAAVGRYGSGIDGSAQAGGVLHTAMSGIGVGMLEGVERLLG
jgi:hypothetical protein